MMTHTLTDSELWDVINDMREQAKAKRDQARALHAADKHQKGFALTSEAIVIEHWANRLEALLNRPN